MNQNYESKYPHLSMVEKLRRWQLTSAGVTLVISVLLIGVMAIWNEWERLRNDANSTARLIGFNSDVALLFDDREAARELLRALASKPEVKGARLFTKDGQAFAEYLANDSDLLFPEVFLSQADRRIELNWRAYTKIHPIFRDDELLGHLYLVFDSLPIWHRMLSTLLLLMVSLLIAFFASILLGKRLASQIVAPLESLSNLAQRVSREKNYHLRAQEISQGKDEITQLIRSFNDMIEQVHVQDSLLKFQRNSLEMEVELRTSDLSQALQQAQASTVAKSQFLANMSHELRTPMNAIIGFAYLLKAEVSKPEHLHKLELLLSSGEHLLNLINDILDLSKIEASQLKLELTPLRLAHVLQEVCSMMSGRVKDKGLLLTLEVDPQIESLTIMGDMLRIRQILLNYLANAVKFTAQGGIQLRARVLNEDEAHIFVRFEVEDSGIGIEETQQQRLFNNFEQAEASTTRKYGGTGLGLAICKKLAELMGGQVGLKSQLQHGSVFWFTAPFEKCAKPVVSSHESNVTEHLWLRGHVLLVEDNVLNLELALEVLKSFGLQVDVAQNGVEAVNKVQQQHYDLVFMDLQMPVMDGLEATRIIRSFAKYQHLPVLALTANVFEEDRSLCEAVGMNGFLTKPIDFENLKQHLLAWLPTSNGHENDNSPIHEHSQEYAHTVLEQHSILAGTNVVDASGNDFNLEWFLSQIVDLLLHDDMQSYFLWNQHRQSLFRCLGEESFQSLDKLIKAFDFPEALPILKAKLAAFAIHS